MANQTLDFSASPYSGPANPGTDQTGAGGTGGNGNDGTYTYKSSNCQYYCQTAPTNGDPGKTGNAGNKGDDGAKGLPGPISTWTLTQVVGDLTINAGGGNGQDGGKGGKGQDGGAGGQPGKVNPQNFGTGKYGFGTECAAANQGPQGPGGKGGLGGNAGPGGEGATVVIYYTSIPGNTTTTVMSGKPGSPGGGGAPGGGPTNNGPGDNGGTASPGSVSKITLIPLS